MKRYRDECTELHQLALTQLNLPKNIIKEDFEAMFLVDIITKLKEEMGELIFELEQMDLDKSRVRAEIGDCAGTLAGILAYIKEPSGSEME